MKYTWLIALLLCTSLTGCSPTMNTPQGTHECRNGSYVNSNGNLVCNPERDQTNPPIGATAQCRDGAYSFSQHRSGTCSHHGGVSIWLQ